MGITDGDKRGVEQKSPKKPPTAVKAVILQKSSCGFLSSPNWYNAGKAVEKIIAIPPVAVAVV